jgi:phosphoribosyl 1,2-cyclic phosphodiesterase
LATFVELCVLASGSSANCTYLASGTTRILVDCGLPARETARRLAEISVDPGKLDGILISHAHTDHFRSAGTMFARYDIPVYTMAETEDAILGKPSCGSFWRVRDCRRFPESLGDISIETFEVPHGGGARDAGRPVGFIFTCGRSRIGHVTDAGELPRPFVKALKGVDALVIEANYHQPIVHKKLRDPSFAGDWTYLKWVDGPTGHLSNGQCVEALGEILTEDTRAVFPAHLSENHYNPRRDNNDFKFASSAISFQVAGMGLRTRICRTFRREKTEGQRSELVKID